MSNELKKKIRNQIKDLKSQISFQEKLIKSDNIFKKVEEHINFQQSKFVLIYWSMDDEVHTHNFILKWANDKEFILPCVCQDKLILKKFEGTENLQTGIKYGIKEPVGEIFPEPEKIDLAIIPGIAFDKEKNRMGRGKAYYDNLLPNLNAYKIAVCFNFQIIESVPVEDHDVKMNEIISD